VKIVLWVSLTKRKKLWERRGTFRAPGSQSCDARRVCVTRFLRNVWVCVHKEVGAEPWVCVSGCTFVYVCMHACMHSCMHVCVCMCVCVCVCVGEMCVVICVCVHTQIYTAATSICEYFPQTKDQSHSFIYTELYISSLSFSCVCVYARACALRPHYQKFNKISIFWPQLW
jgi:hypothetical protein